MDRQEPSPAARIVPAGDFALVIVDVQDRLAAVMHRRDDVVKTASMLVRASAVLGAPVFVTRQYHKGLGDTVPELGAVLDEVGFAGAQATVVDKVAFDCLAELAFRDALAGSGKRHIVLAGMEAHICVSQTAFSLAEDGYVPHVVSDGVCSRHDADRDASLARMLAAGVDVLPGESVIYEALGKAGTPEFRAMLDVVKGA